MRKKLMFAVLALLTLGGSVVMTNTSTVKASPSPFTSGYTEANECKQTCWSIWMLPPNGPNPQKYLQCVERWCSE